MNKTAARILIIDDLFGREILGAKNREKENLCGKFLLEEETTEGKSRSGRFEIDNPIARAVFWRGQTPIESGVGAIVENDLQSSLKKVREGWTESIIKGQPPWSMVLLDLCFYTGLVTEESNRRIPGMPEGRAGDDNPRNYFGLTLLDAIHYEFPELPIFILSSKPRHEVSLEFSRRGALGFIARDDARGSELLAEALWHHGLLPDTTGEIIGNSLPLLLALREARRSSKHRENILLRGERGTGKELFARYINRVSGENPSTGTGSEISEKPLVTVNSAVFTPNLFASELFGIKSRTATGVDGKIGLIESANGGDLFLDEIADMQVEVQAALLDVLQKREFTPVGGRKPISVDVRFISATNASIEDESSGFRSDLYDRLCNGGTIWLPPLRDRLTDIPLLVEKFIREAEELSKTAMHRIVTPEALEMLLAHDWAGNIRELRSVIFDAVNRQANVEFLVPQHLRLQNRAPGKDTKKTNQNFTPRNIELGGNEFYLTNGNSLDELLNAISSFLYESNKINEWSGRLSEVQLACQKLLARHLEVCLKATKRRTHENPEGIIQIHPAVKLITGNSKITASKAADIVKRLLAPLKDEGLNEDLLEAYEIAMRLRPKSSIPSSRKKFPFTS